MYTTSRKRQALDDNPLAESVAGSFGFASPHLLDDEAYHIYQRQQQPQQSDPIYQISGLAGVANSSSFYHHDELGNAQQITTLSQEQYQLPPASLLAQDLTTSVTKGKASNPNIHPPPVVTPSSFLCVKSCKRCRIRKGEQMQSNARGH